MLAWGCGGTAGDKNKLPSNIVNNPSSASESPNNGVARIEFENEVHDFGKLIQGEKVTYAFKFKNTGDGNLIISDVGTSCGCTIPKYTTNPIKPGESGTVRVTFESEGRRGFQNKTVSVVTNTQPNTKVLKIKAQIILPEKNY